MDISAESLPLFAASRRAYAHDMAADDFTGAVRQFCGFGARTEAFVDDAIPYLVNEFWTSGQRQAHSIHEVSYRACFKAQLPEFFIRHLTKTGDTVYDPFMGRGTTPIQAALMGRRPAGNDVNPLSVLLTRPRLQPPGLAAIEKRLGDVSWHLGQPEPQELLAFFSPATLVKITALKHWLRDRATSSQESDPVDDWIRMVAINRLTGHSPGFFSVYTLPPNQAVSISSQIKINRQREQQPPDRDVAQIILKKSRSLLSDGAFGCEARPLLMTGESHCTPTIPDASIALVVTSPPFLDIVQYADDNWLRCWFAGIDVARVSIARHRTEAGWERMVRDTLTELARIVRPGGHVAFEVGEVRGGKILLERLVWRAASGLPFERLFVMINQQSFTKTANCWGVRNNTKGTNTNRIVVLRRTGD